MWSCQWCGSGMIYSASDPEVGQVKKMSFRKYFPSNHVLLTDDYDHFHIKISPKQHVLMCSKGRIQKHCIIQDPEAPKVRKTTWSGSNKKNSFVVFNPRWSTGKIIFNDLIEHKSPCQIKYCDIFLYYFRYELGNWCLWVSHRYSVRSTDRVPTCRAKVRASRRGRHAIVVFAIIFNWSIVGW